MRSAFILFVLFAVWAGTAAMTQAAEPETTSRADAERLFAVEVFSLFESKCIACHGGDPQDIQGGFNLRSRRTALQGGASGEAAIVPGRPERSPLYLAVQWDGLEMPPKENDRLTAAQIESVRQWIAGGAPWPDAERRAQLASKWSADDGVAVSTSGGTSAEWTNRLYRPDDLWAYQPLVQPAVPCEHAGGSGNAVDAFVNRRLAKAGIEPAPRADKRTLIRRVTYDLTGLPPTPEEIADFLEDDSQTAYRDVVERLLASPRYGEQWGKHWLDVVRYADTSGFSNDHARPNTWRYRDYVIRAFNSDKPYDEFIREQIAGDELDPTDVENLIAVGFLRMGPWEHTSMSVAAVTRQQFLDDITNQVGEVFLGHALRCASCHDHKFDPIPTRDYYRLQAVFAPVQFADRTAPFLAVENTTGFQEGEERVRTLLATGGVQSLETIPKSEWPVDSFDADTEIKGHAKVNNKRREALTRELNRYKPLAFSAYSGPPRTYVSNKPLHPMPPPEQLQGAAEVVHILRGGALESPGEKVTPGVMSVTVGLYSEDDQRRPDEDRSGSGTFFGRNVPPTWGGSSPKKVPDPLNLAAEEARELASIPSDLHGRRIALAEWIASADNPLTARVMVNRIWQYHFGRALAGNPNNFGQTGKKPTHPELLDYLASSFIEHGWSVKAMHRLILLSDAYQRSGTHPQSGPLRQQDPDNELLAEFSPRRLSAEELRDSLLLVSGELNLEMGGIPVRPEINREVAMQPRHIMGSVAPAYQPMRTPAERHRRTIYAERIRTLRDPLLEVFNQPGLDASCERRDSSATTPQVFALFNSQNSYDRAIALASRLQREADGEEAQITAAFQLALGRSPAAEELALCREHIQRLVPHHRDHPPAADPLPRYVIRQMVEEMTGLKFYWVEELDIYQDFVPDVKGWDVDAKTRALADLCLVLFNSNEFIYVY